MMTSDPSIFNGDEKDIERDDMYPDYEASVTVIGENAPGSFGPAAGTSEAESVRLAEQGTKPEYRTKASNVVVCIDGRFNEGQLSKINLPGKAEEAPWQVAGSLPITETGAGFMGASETHRPLSVAVAEETASAVKDSLKVRVHGAVDNKKGCKANEAMRPALSFIAANQDILAPIVWEDMKILKLDQFLTTEDVLESMNNGRQAAENDELWDVEADEVIDIMVANGAEYDELEGDHYEESGNTDYTEDGAFEKLAYGRDHKNPVDGGPGQILSATLGRYAKVNFERAKNAGLTDREAALKVLRGVIYNKGCMRLLLNEQARVGVEQPKH